MNKKSIIIVVIIIVIGGILAFSRSPKTEMARNQVPAIDQQKETESMPSMAGSYEKYSAEKIALASASHDVVLFFRAAWCPTCRSVDADIRSHLKAIPESLTLLDVDYDNSTDLKKKYGVTYQHTFVQVDAQGNPIKKWTGSPTLASLISEVK